MPARKALCFFIITYSFCIVSLSFADDFRVFVLEKGSGMAVDGATVVLGESDTFLTSGEDGVANFSDESRPEFFKVLAAGYETKIWEIKDKQPPYKIYLQPIIYEGQGLEVVAERIKEKGSKVVLSKKELLLAPGSQGDPLKAITALPGVMASGDGQADVYMRGSGVDENIVWVNSAPVGYLYHWDGLSSTINPHLIEDINVFLAGFPVEYGDAIGGAVDARLRKPENDRMHYKFDLATYASSFLVEGPVGAAGGNDSFFVAGRRSYIDLLYSTDTFNDAFGDDDEDADKITKIPQFYDFQALYNHILPQGNIDLYYFGAGDELAIDINDSGKSDPQLQGRFDSNTAYNTLGSTWDQTWSDTVSHTMNLSWRNYEDKTQFGQDDDGAPFFIRAKMSGIHAQPELHWQQNPSQMFTAGVSYDYLDIPVDMYTSRMPTENDRHFDFTSQEKFRLKRTLYANSVGPYIKHRYQWTDDLVTTLGLRYTNTEVTGGFEASEFSPRASIEYSLFTDTLLTASAGRFRQIPESSTIIDTFGNPGLCMTRSDHYVLGVDQKLNDLYSVKTEVYYKDMKDLVIPVDDRLPPDNFVNEGTGKAVGVDIFLRRKRKDRKMGWIGLSVSDSERTNEITGVTRDFTGDRPYAVTIVWGQPFPGIFDKWLWSFRFQAHSGQPYTKLIGRHREDPNDPNSRWIPEWGKHNGERTPIYYKLDLRIDREFYYNEWKMKFYVDLQNATFHENIEGYDYGSEYEDINNATPITGLGFMPFFGIEAEF